MNKFSFILLALGALLLSCKTQTIKEATASVPQVSDFTIPDSTWYDDSEMTLCYSDEELIHPSKEMSKDPFMSKLVDAYNCAVIWRNVYTDMELIWRFCPDHNPSSDFMKYIVSNFQSIEYMRIKDDQMRAKCSKYIQAAIRAARDSTATFMGEHDAYADAIFTYYHTDKFGHLTQELFQQQYDYTQYVPEYDALAEKRVQDDSVHQAVLIKHLKEDKNINRRCLYALEYAYSSSEGPYFHKAVPYLVEVMLAGQYSPYMADVWRTWRAMMSTHMGMSRDSHIPNVKYNQLRKICAMTVLKHIEQHPDDMLAVNTFLTLTYTVNINRFGSFMFGNESMNEQAMMFPEYFMGILGDE